MNFFIDRIKLKMVVMRSGRRPGANVTNTPRAVRTLDGTRLLAEMSAMAREAGLLNTSGGESQDVGSGQFTIHTLEFNILKADWGSLKAFYVALQRRSPYIGIEQFQTTVDRANPALLNVNFRVSSVEIARGAAP